MPALFKERNLNATGKLLPYGEFRFFRDCENAEINAEKRADILARAERFLSEPITPLYASTYALFMQKGDRRSYENLYFPRREMAMTLALAESLEGRGRFTMKLVDVLYEIMEETTWVISAHQAYIPAFDGGTLPPQWGDMMHGLDLFAAATGAVFALVLQYASDALDKITPVICRRMRYELDRRIFDPYLHQLFWWSGEVGNRPNNWNPWVSENVLFAACVALTDNARREEIANRVIEMTDWFVQYYPEDGGCDEGPSYWNHAVGSYFDVLDLLYDMSGGALDLYSVPLVRKMCEYELKFYITGDWFLNFADCPPRFRPNGALLCRMGEKCGSEALTAFGREMSKAEGIAYDSYSCAPYRTLRTLITPPVYDAEPIVLSRVWMPDLKVMVARNDESGRGLYLAAKGGTNGDSHNHNDVGSVTVFADGKPLLIDTGAGTYMKKTFSLERYELWYMRSLYHNVANIADCEQQPGEEYASQNEVYDETTGSLTMELCGAYPKEAHVRSYVRRAELDGDVIRITDTLSLDAEENVDFHFLTCVKPTLGDGKIALAYGREMIFDPSLSAEIEEFPVDDETLETRWKTPVLWRIHLRARIKDGSYSFVIR